MDAGLHGALRVGHVAAEVAVANVDVDVGRQLSVLRADRGWSPCGRHLGNFAQWHGAAGWHRHQDFVGDSLGIVPQVARISHVDREPLPPLDRRRHGLAAERRRDGVLNVLDHDAVARERGSVRRHFEIVAANAALRVGRRCSRHGFENLLDLLGELIDLNQIGADHLDADRRADAGRQHVDAGLDRHCPSIRDAGKLQGPIHFGDQAVDGHAGAPLLLRPEIDHRLEHLGRGRIGRGRGASRLAVDRGDFRKRADDPVLGLHQFAGLCDRDSG